MKKKILLTAMLIAVMVVGGLCVNSINSKASEGNGKILEVKGVLSYVVDGEVKEDFTGPVTHDGMTYAVENGIVKVDYTGLFRAKLENAIYIYVVNGIKDSSYNGLVTYRKDRYNVKNGEVKDFGSKVCYYIEEVNGKKYYFCNAKVSNGLPGIHRQDDIRYYVVNGEVCTIYTGIYTCGRISYYIEKGIVNEKRSAIIDYAFKQLDARGEVDSKTGIEFVRKVFEVNDIVLPDNIQDIVSTGTEVNYENMRPGDLLVYNRTENYSEIGIYVGNDKMICTFPLSEIKIVDIKEDSDYNNITNVINYTDIY